MGAFSVQIQLSGPGFEQFSTPVALGNNSDKVLKMATDAFIEKFTLGVVDNLTKKAREFAPKRTGNLRKNITAIEETSGKWKLMAGTNYASMVEYGTGLFALKGKHHWIYPKRCKFLVFRGRDGRLVFAKRVRGQKPRLYMNRAIQQLGWAVEESWKKMGTNASVIIGRGKSV